MNRSIRVATILALAAVCMAIAPSRSSAQQKVADGNTLGAPRAMQWPQPVVPPLRPCRACVLAFEMAQTERTPISLSDDRAVPKWTYPVIGAVAGGVAGWLYVDNFVSPESSMGSPVPLTFIFPVLGAAAGAVVGAIVAHVTP